jgi:CheY-like chemotaxis protein
MVLVFVTDLFFDARIREVAGQLGVEVEIARDAGVLQARARELRPGLVLVDLHARGGDAVTGIAGLRADPATSGLRVVAFVSHVKEDLIAAAEAAGADLVLTRGQLTKKLPSILAPA